MEIKIYQINMDRDTKRVAFQDLERLEMFQGSKEIDSTIYDRVYQGEVNCAGLEDVFKKFNLEFVPEFAGHSLSVSDVVEVVSDGKPEKGFYFCDSVGFEKVEFHPELAGAKKMLRVVLLEPGKLARDVEINASLFGMQRVLQGKIERYTPFAEQVCIVTNEEGKNKGLDLNRAVRGDDVAVEMSYPELAARFRQAERDGTGVHLTGRIVFTEDSFDKPYPLDARTYIVSSNNKAYQPNMGGYSIYGSSVDGSDPMIRLEAYMAAEKGGKDGWKVERCFLEERSREIMDVIAGTCFICGLSDGEPVSLTGEQAKRYMTKFRYPERITFSGSQIVAIPYDPRIQQRRQERGEAR